MLRYINTKLRAFCSKRAVCAVFQHKSDRIFAVLLLSLLTILQLLFFLVLVRLGSFLFLQFGIGNARMIDAL